MWGLLIDQLHHVFRIGLRHATSLITVLDRRIEELSEAVRQLQSSEIDEFTDLSEKTTSEVGLSVNTRWIGFGD